jgi:hypothetical protein
MDTKIRHFIETIKLFIKKVCITKGTGPSVMHQGKGVYAVYPTPFKRCGTK